MLIGYKLNNMIGIILGLLFLLGVIMFIYEMITAPVIEDYDL